MFEEPVVSFTPNPGAFSIAGAEILVDDDDYEGVHIAAENLSKDFAKVTGRSDNPKVSMQSLGEKPRDSIIIIGTVSQSSIIKSLKAIGKISTSKIDGKWETWMTVTLSKPLRGYKNALLIIGSDKRGAIFGAYSLAEQIGVSPWHWWADVPIKRHSGIYALPVSTINGEPSVKYRGIFINDECPAMDSWAQEKFGPVFDSNLYSTIFELLLRLKANFLWPGMWRGYPYPGRSFFVDDPENQKMAHRYGIVMGTSHHEPMQRAMNEWSTNEPEGTWNWETNKDKIKNYFDKGAERAVPYESYITMGMRAEGDGPVSGDKPVEIITDVLASQRAAIKTHYGNEDGEMQLYAMYKEVQQYYEDGLEIPDDITLLFSDDNFGSIRRLPTEKELGRKGGIGIYYHFEYTGYPRSYRWMNSTTMGKTLHQLQYAHHKGAKQIWIFNVGDLKPQEIPMSFAFDLAWNINSVHTNGLGAYLQSLATREFGSLGHKHCTQIRRAWYDFDRLIALRKHEHIEPDTFMLLKHNEAETIVARWKELVESVEAINAEIDDAFRPAFFELVLYPIKASYIYVSLRVTQYKNQLYAKQRRNMTNVLFHKCISMFDADFELVQEFHALLGGKWNHMLRQPHYGYTSPNGMQPSRDMISGLCYVQTKADSNPSVGHMGIAVEGTGGVNPGLISEDSDKTHPSRNGLERGVTLPYLSPYGPQHRWFEVFHRGTKTFSWVAKPQYDWIKLSQQDGTMRPEDEATRVHVNIDWDKVSGRFDEKTYIEIIGSVDGYEKVRLTVKNRRVPRDFTGLVESDGYVSIEPGQLAIPAPFLHLTAMGRLLSGSVTLPNDTDFSSPDSIPFLHYPMYIFTSQEDAALELHFNMTLETDPDSRMEYDLRWDGGDVQTHRLTQDGGDQPIGWSAAVQDCVWKRTHSVGSVEAGSHMLEVRFRKGNMCLEKLWLDLRGLQYSYLGPPQSDYVKGHEDDGHGYVGVEDSLEIKLIV